MMRPCYRCKEQKPIDDFYKGAWLCKPCHKIRDSQRQKRSTVTNDTESARARKRRWSQSHEPDERNAARRAVRNAIVRGEIVRLDSCESCGQSPKRADGITAVQAHHDDYSKPLSVRWLCAKCHTKWHKEHDAALAAQQSNGEAV